MIRRRLNLLSFALKAVTLLLPALAFAIAAQIRFFSGIFGRPEASAIDPMLYFDLLLFTMFAWALTAGYFGLWRTEHLFAPRGKVRRLFLASLTTWGAVVAFGFFYRAGSFSRIFVALCGLLLFVLTGVIGLGFRALLRRQQNGKSRSRILMIGADRFACTAGNQLASRGIMPCNVVGYVRLPGQVSDVEGMPVYELDQVDELASACEVDDVIIAVQPERFGEVAALTKKLEPLNTPVRAIVDLGEHVFAREQLFEFGGMVMLDLQVTPAETVQYLILKRAFDIVFSLIVILITAPVMALIGLTIKLTSPGPILFVQDRVGLNGKVFRMYKFRSMWVEAGGEGGTHWTIPNDPQRTPFGAFLRRYNLDELPQFFNVLMGDMSVVGPRPERPYFVRTFLQDVARYNSRHYLKVGVTGWAQINGLRGDTSIARRVEYDLYYLRNWTFLLDLQIIGLTLLRGLTSKNAY